MWVALILPILAVLVGGVMTLASAGNSRSGAAASLKLFAGGAMVLLAGYAFITLISKLT
jgi:hypothetical protein